MRVVQVLILIALVVVAGLLFMVWKGQQQAADELASPPAAVQPAEPAVPEAASSQETRSASAPALPARAGRAAAPAAGSANVRASSPAGSTPPSERTAERSEAAPAPAVTAAPQLSDERSAAAPAPAADPLTPLPPREPRSVTGPAGTLLSVRLGETISTEKVQAGYAFTATLDKPLVVDGLVIAERGAKVEGRVIEAEQPGRVRGVASLAIHLTRLRTSDGQSVAIQTDPFRVQGETSRGEDAKKIGIGAGLGAAIGAIAGGGKGAAIGTAVGGTAGAGTVAATRGKHAVLRAETRIDFRISQPLTLTEKRQAS